MNIGTPDIMTFHHHGGPDRLRRVGLGLRMRPHACLAPDNGPSSSGEDASTLRRMVLVVDDSEPYRRALKMMLESVSNIEIVEAKSGEEALEVVATAHPHLVFMDINLPGIDGIETTARVIASAPDTVIVGLSIYTDEQMQVAIRKAGAKALVNKESGISTVLAVLNSYL